MPKPCDQSRFQLLLAHNNHFEQLFLTHKLQLLLVSPKVGNVAVPQRFLYFCWLLYVKPADFLNVPFPFHMHVLNLALLLLSVLSLQLQSIVPRFEYLFRSVLDWFDAVVGGEYLRPTVHFGRLSFFPVVLCFLNTFLVAVMAMAGSTLNFVCCFRARQPAGRAGLFF